MCIRDSNEIDFVVASSRKQDGISTTADGTLTIFQYSSSSNSRFPFVSSTINPTTEEWRQDIVSFAYSGDNITDLVVTHTDEDKIKFFLKETYNLEIEIKSNAIISKNILTWRIIFRSFDIIFDTSFSILNFNNMAFFFKLVRNLMPFTNRYKIVIKFI
mgnify:CR=1 FL=1